MFDVLLGEVEKNLKREVRDFVKNDVPSSLVKKMDSGEVQYPSEFLDAASQRNLLGLRFPKKYGGRGLNWVAELTVIEEIGVLGVALGCLYSLPSIVGEAINQFGSEEQKTSYLKPTLEGKLHCSEALTEPRGGSDFFGMATQAVREGEYYVLNGQKRFVVGAEGADYFLVYAKTAPKAPPHESISVFLVDRDMGVEVKKVYGLLGARGGGTGRILFKDTMVPVENRVGVENTGGVIFNQMMIPERLTSAAGAIGPARTALEVATRYSHKRKAFGKPIRRFQAVSFLVANSICLLNAAQSLTYTAGKTVDEGKNARRIVSEAKKFSTEAAWQIINNAMQIMGGIGYTNIYPIERLLRDIRLTMIWTGTNEIMNLLIQHEYYKEILSQKEYVRDIEKDALGIDEIEKVFE